MADEQLNIKIKQELEGKGISDLNKIIKDSVTELDLLTKAGGQATQKFVELAEKVKQARLQIQELKKDYGLQGSAKTVDTTASQLKAQAEANILRKAPSVNIGDIGSIQYLQAMKKGYQELMSSVSPTSAKFQEYKAKVKEVDSELRTLKGTAKMSGMQLLELGENATVVAAGLSAVYNSLKNSVSKVINEAAENKSLHQFFKGTEQDLASFRAATQNTVTDSGLMKLSNQATDLGISMKDQPTLFVAAENAAQKYSTGVEEGFQRVIAATEGQVKGLKSLGIQKAEYNQLLQSLVNAEGGVTEEMIAEGEERNITIKGLDAEAQKRIRVQAMIQILQKNYGDLSTREKTEQEILGGVSTKVEEAEEKFGSYLLKGVRPLAESILGLNGNQMLLVGGVGKTISIFTQMLPVIAAARMAFAGLQLSMGGIVGIIAAIAALAVAFSSASDDYSGLADEMAKTNSQIKSTEEELNNLAIVNGNIKATTEEYDNAVKNLVEKYPALSDGVDENTGKIKLNKQSVDDLNDSLKEQLKFKEELRTAEQEKQTFATIDEYDKAKDKISDLNNEMQRYQKYIKDYQDSRFLEIDSKGVTIVTKEWADYYQRRIAEIKADILKLESPLNMLKTKFREQIIEGMKNGNIVDILRNMEIACGGDIKKINAMKDAFNGLSNSAVAEFLKIDQALKNSAQLQDMFANAMNFIKSENPFLKQQGQDLMKQIIAYTPKNQPTAETPKKTATNDTSSSKSKESREDEKNTLEEINKIHQSTLNIIEEKIKRDEETVENKRAELELWLKELTANEEVIKSEGHQQEYLEKIESLTTDIYSINKKIRDDATEKVLSEMGKEFENINKQITKGEVGHEVLIELIKQQRQTVTELESQYKSLGKSGEEELKKIQKSGTDLDSKLDEANAKVIELKKSLGKSIKDLRTDDYDDIQKIREKYAEERKQMAEKYEKEKLLQTQYQQWLALKNKQEKKDIDKAVKESQGKALDETINGFQQIQGISENIKSIFAGTGENFLQKFIRILQIVQQIKAIMETIATIKTLLNIISGGTAVATGGIGGGGSVVDRITNNPGLLSANNYSRINNIIQQSAVRNNINVPAPVVYVSSNIKEQKFFTRISKQNAIYKQEKSLR